MKRIHVLVAFGAAVVLSAGASLRAAGRAVNAVDVRRAAMIVTDDTCAVMVSHARKLEKQRIEQSNKLEKQRSEERSKLEAQRAEQRNKEIEKIKSKERADHLKLSMARAALPYLKTIRPYIVNSDGTYTCLGGGLKRYARYRSASIRAKNEAAKLKKVSSTPLIASRL